MEKSFPSAKGGAGAGRAGGAKAAGVGGTPRTSSETTATDGAGGISLLKGALTGGGVFKWSLDPGGSLIPVRRRLAGREGRGAAGTNGGGARAGLQVAETGLIRRGGQGAAALKIPWIIIKPVRGIPPAEGVI